MSARIPSLRIVSSVHKARADRADTLEAMNKTAAKTDSESENKQFFQSSLASGYGSGPGKFLKPYNQTKLRTQQQRNQQNPPPSSTHTNISSQSTLTIGTYLSRIASIPAQNVRGSIGHHLEEWLRITKDPWILHIVRGYSLEFLSPPPLSLPPQDHTPLSEEKTLVLEAEIQSLVEKRAIHQIHPNKSFYSKTFVIPKKDGGWRPIIN